MHARVSNGTDRRTSARQRWLQVHLWLALTLGLVFALLGASGAVLVLRAPLLQWEVGYTAVRLTHRPTAGTSLATPEHWKQAALTAYPQLQRALGAAAPGQGFLVSENALVFGPVRDRPGTGIAMVDPYSAEPRAFFVYDELLLAKAVALHRSLFLPRGAAGPAVALAGLALLLSLGTGAWLWWPRGPWRTHLGPALSFHLRSQGLRRWRELHNVCGAWLLLPLLVLAWTGAWLAEPGWWRWVGLGRSFKPTASGLHSELLLGGFGQALVFLAGIALPVLYLSGLVMWWRKRTARRAGRRSRPLSRMESM